MQNPRRVDSPLVSLASSSPASLPTDEASSAPAVRRCLYLARDPDAALVAYLAARHWDVSLAISSKPVRRRERPGAVHAGIVDLDGFDTHEAAALEPMLRSKQIGWIALVDPLRLAEPEVRQLIHRYCFDYLTRPSTYAAVDHAVNRASWMADLREHDCAPDGANVGGHGMVGASEAMQRLFRSIEKVAKADAPVFISGESGTGKELTARAIHAQSGRSKAPFIAINCGAIPPHLLQSELFGYERGAFTGANHPKIGRIEAADGGTLFLDEIGDLPFESGASLLRFLSDKKIERLGGHASIPVDVRVITATHVDLDAAIDDGRFRADLFYRLCVLRINEPPLRERGGDIELIAYHILQKFRGDAERMILGFTGCAHQAMHAYSWPGNVRELINRIRRAIVMADSRLISAADLGLDQFITPVPTTLAQAREGAEKSTIEAALLRHRNQHIKAASELGISRATLYRLLNSHGL
ncbi:sigma 54-interacting transcriptional regulator [Burkholderia sp. 22PA0106]|uniref:sigma-54 dependent transcriptional regulator n=1 Tax=Burkholderia sp. 22PA0106 TaxID=3237371 RepID=UPI0039C145E4